MSGGVSCICEAKDKRKNWRVVQRYCRHSAFDGYQRMSSAYSTVTCLICPGTWRTKAGYVAGLKDYCAGETI